MKNLKTFMLVTGFALLASAPAAQADMASGTYNVNGGSYVPLWDISGAYPSDISEFGAMDLVISHSPTGKLSGAGDFSALGYYDGVDMDLAGDSVAGGAVSGPSQNPKVTLILGVAGSGTVEGYSVSSFTATLRMNLSIDTMNDRLIGHGAARITITLQNPYTGRWITRSGSEPMGGVENSLPGSADGNWSLTLNLIPSGTRYTGTANIVTTPGSSVDFTATGTYNAKTDRSTIRLAGTGAGAGTSLTLVVSPAGQDLTIHSLKGKLFGQSLNYKAPAN
jgi:hypothetical protein